jgi:hypothetical protein
MTRKFSPIAIAAALLVVGACGRSDNTTYDTAAGAVATPPPPAFPTTGLSVGATTGTTTGATSIPRDTLTKRSPY